MRALPAVAPARIPRRSPGDDRAARPRHLRVVDTDARRRERRRRLVGRAWATGMVLAALAGVGVHAAMAQSQMRLEQLDRRIAREVVGYENARLMVAEAQAPAVVITRATELGLVQATVSRSVPVPGPADRQTTDSDHARRARDWEAVKPLLEGSP